LITPEQLTRFRSVSFGGVLGAAAGLVISAKLPVLHSYGLDSTFVLVLAASIGAAVHSFIDKVLIAGVVGPSMTTLTHYFRVLEIWLARRNGLLDDATAARYIRTLSDAYYLRGVRIQLVEETKPANRVSSNV
jgi:hypothetical protein